MTVLSMLIAQQRENHKLLDRIRVLEESVSQHKLWLSNALDEIARLRADQSERGRLT